MRTRWLRIAAAIQPAARDEHVADARGEDDGAERRETEKAETSEARVFERAVRHEIRRRADEREHPADQPRKTQRHHQPSRRELLPLGHEQHHRDEDRDDAGRTHDRAQPRDGEHQQGEQPPFAARRAAQQEIADPIREPRAHEPFADDEERGDEHDIRIAESRERLRHRQHARERQRDHREQRDHIHARLVRDEQRDARPEQTEDKSNW